MTQKLESRVDSIEEIVKELATAQIKTEKQIQALTNEVKNFKDGVKSFKDEMRDFKNEMLEFKEEARADRKRMNKQWGELVNKMGTVVEDIFDYFPEYKGKKIIPVFSSLYLSEDIVKYLSKNKVYAMAMNEDTMDILNPDLKL